MLYEVITEIVLAEPHDGTVGLHGYRRIAFRVGNQRLFPERVITSYSIHYTKLYEYRTRRVRARQEARRQDLCRTRGVRHGRRRVPHDSPERRRSEALDEGGAAQRSYNFV